MAVVARAERLISAPVGSKIRSDEARLEHTWTTDDNDRSEWVFGTGIGLSYDLEIVYERNPGRPRALTFNASYNYVPPVVDITPGISFGVLDAVNRTKDGRAPYVAISYRLGQYGDFNSDVPATVSFGFRGGKNNGLFTAIDLPFADSFRLLAEHDAIRLTAGVEVRPFRGLGLRWLFRQDEARVTVQYRWRF